MKFAIRLAFLTICIAAVSSAGIIIDQQNLAPPTNAGVLAPVCLWQQGITSGQSGYLDGIDLYFHSDGLPESVTAKILYGGAYLGEDTQLYEGTEGPAHFDFSTDNIFFNPGDAWVLEVTGNDPNWNLDIALSDNTYVGGQLFANRTDLGQVESYPQFDFRFTEYVNEQSGTPEPGSFVMVGLGAAALAVLRRKLSR